ncbi:MAG: LysR family transcriptional regulator [Cyanobacteria bacterium J06598_3]
MNLSNIDLNLLLVFQTLMTHRHVTRAGQALGLSQPATSNALSRLRKLLDDELFIRSAHGLQPTPKALDLAQQIQPALNQIQAALAAPPAFHPATSQITFNIGMSDYVEFVLLPPLLNKIQSVAPGVSLQIRSGDRSVQLAMLDRGELDLLCGLFPEEIDYHQQQHLFQETFVGVCRRSHPTIQADLSLKAYAAANHLLVSIKEDRIGRVDHLLAKRGLQRHIAISVPHFLVVPGIIAKTDLVTTLAERVARTFAQLYSLQVLPLPFDMEGFYVYMRWHKSNEKQLAQQWLRALVSEVSSQALGSQ